MSSSSSSRLLPQLLSPLVPVPSLLSSLSFVLSVSLLLLPSSSDCLPIVYPVLSCRRLVTITAVSVVGVDDVGTLTAAVTAALGLLLVDVKSSE